MAPHDHDDPRGEPPVRLILGGSVVLEIKTPESPAVLALLKQILEQGAEMSQIVATTATKVDTLITAVKGLEALADTLKADLDAVIAGGTLSAEDTATLQASSDKIDAALAEVAAKITADTPPAPAPAPV